MTQRRIVFAPDSFKGTITAAETAAALAEGWRDVEPEAHVDLRPMADGGEGTLDAFETAIPGARRIPVTVTAPAGSPHQTLLASWLLLPPDAETPGGTGVVELASTAGIELYREGLQPWRASTRAFGEAIAAALDAGVSKLVLAIGSSASTDGGAGMLAALGARFEGAPGDRPIGAGNLAGVVAADLSGLRELPAGGALVLTDVTNPLLGESGAAAVFGPQKGFAVEEVETVDAAMRSYAALLPADAAEPGTGAAGGTGFGLRVWGARLTPGAPTVAELIGLRSAVEGAALVVTGEGRFDAQSGAGKVPAFVAQEAAAAGVPVALVAGLVDAGADLAAFAEVASLTHLAGSPEASMASPGTWLRAAGAALARR